MSGIRRFYVGYPSMEGLPLRIGDGFEAHTIAEARIKACDILADTGGVYKYGYLCHITKDGNVTLHGSIRCDGHWSRYLTFNGMMPVYFPETEWTPVKRL